MPQTYTSARVSNRTLERLHEAKRYDREPINDVIERLLDEHEDPDDA